MIIKREYSVWCIVDLGNGNYIAQEEIVPPLSLTTIHEVLEFDNEAEYTSKCAELGIELESLEDFEV